MLNRRQILLGLGVLLTAPAALAETPMFYTLQGAAMSGYDPVTYFNGKGPQRGQPAIAVMWKGAVWHFANDANREAFEANPRAYAPQFGGYCAYAMAQGYATSTEPELWHIVDGKLYLTHSEPIDVLWQQDRDENIALAEANWPAVLYD